MKTRVVKKDFQMVEIKIDEATPNQQSGREVRERDAPTERNETKEDRGERAEAKEEKDT